MLQRQSDGESRPAVQTIFSEGIDVEAADLVPLRGRDRLIRPGPLSIGTPASSQDILHHGEDLVGLSALDGQNAVLEAVIVEDVGKARAR